MRRKRIFKVFGILLAIVLLLFFIGFFALDFYLDYWSINNPGAAFGDGSSIYIPVDSNKVLPIRSVANVNDVLVSVSKTGRFNDTDILEELDEEWIYWYVDITLQNDSQTTIDKIYPVYYSRIQGLLQNEEGYTYPYSDFGDATIDNSMKGFSDFSPGETIEGRLIYKVPLNKDELYWIYGESSVDNAIFKLR